MRNTQADPVWKRRQPVFKEQYIERQSDEECDSDQVGPLHTLASAPAPQEIAPAQHLIIEIHGQSSP